jgi:hypothetical protein
VGHFGVRLSLCLFQKRLDTRLVVHGW